MIRKALLLKFLDAAYMQRWNDKIRPVELIELDKQAHKMIVAWFLARVEEDRGTPVSWTRIIAGSCAPSSRPSGSRSAGGTRTTSSTGKTRWSAGF